MTNVTAAPRTRRTERQTDPDAHRARPKSGGLGISEARRRENRGRSHLVEELVCECFWLNCRATVPAIAEAYRGAHDRFIVVPAHAGALVAKVIAAADRFFVVESTHPELGTRARR